MTATMRCVLIIYTAMLSLSASNAKTVFAIEQRASIPRGDVRQVARKHVGNNSITTKEVIVRGGAHAKAPAKLLTESMAGMTVALASIPSSIAFAAIAGVDPMVGVWSSVILGAVSSLAGMRAGVIAGKINKSVILLIQYPQEVGSEI